MERFQQPARRAGTLAAGENTVDGYGLQATGYGTARSLEPEAWSLEPDMLTHYLILATKVLLRRKFFTFISLFAISFTLLVLTIATAMLDHAFGPAAPETRQDRTLAVQS